MLTRLRPWVNRLGVVHASNVRAGCDIDGRRDFRHLCNAHGETRFASAALTYFLIAGESLDEIAAETCSDVAGESMLIALGMIGGAVNEAEREGFTGAELGSAMRRE